MKKGVGAILIIVGILLVLMGSAVSRYNSLVTLETKVDASWAQVENQLQRRADLVPNLVATVQGYASHEQEIFRDIADARARLLGASSPGAQMEASNGLDGALGRLLAISENYPDLKADQSFIRLQDELAGTENRIAVERMRYNESVQVWNQTVKQFPTVVLASMLGKSEKPFFRAQEGAQEAPKIQF